MAEDAFVSDVPIPAPAPRQTDPASTNVQLASVSESLRLIAVLLRQDRAVSIALKDQLATVPAAVTSSLVDTTANAAYNQAEIQGIITTVDALVTAVNALRTVLEAVCSEADTEVVTF